MAFGKKNEVSLDPTQYSLMILGESGVGKTTLIKEYCELAVGEDGYLFLDLGMEDGCRAIDGIIYETCENWEKFEEVIDDIVLNKTNDYPKLKYLVWDTLDQLFMMAEEETMRLHNNKYDKTCKSINDAWGGFGKGMDKAIEIILDKKQELRRVGVEVIGIGHVKNKSLEDVMTETSYSSLTSSLSQKYYNAFKTKTYFVGVAYIDRNIVKEKTGKKDIKGNELSKNSIKNEVRKIAFRDDNYSIDSKSRFADIESPIDLNAESLLSTLTKAIEAEHSKGKKTKAETKKDDIKKEKEVKEQAKKVGESKELETIINVIKEFISKSKDEGTLEIMALPLIDKAKEMGYTNPIAIDKLEDAKVIIELIKEIQAQ